jgi:predicted MFS family arabinose efflux permease
LIPAGSAADYANPRRQFTIGLILMGLTGVVVALTPSYAVALAARVVAGAAVAMTFTASLKLVAVRFTRDIRGKAVGVMDTATGLGTLTALSLLPVLSQWVNYQYLLLSLPLVCAGALALLPSAGIDQAAAGEPSGRPRTPLRGLLDRNLALITVTALLGLFTANGALGWLPTHLTQVLHYTKVQSGYIMGIVLVGQMTGVYPAGILSDRMGRRLPLVYFGTATLLVSFLGLTVVGRGVLLTARLRAGDAGGISVAVTPLTVLAIESVGPDRAGVISSITVAAAQAGSGLAGVIFGWVLDRTGSFTAIWLAAAAISAARLVLASRIREHHA